MKLLSTLFLIGISFLSQTAQAETKTPWVYTSIYKEFIAPIKKEFEAKNPGVEVSIFQAGSEKIQSKVSAELMAKKLQADLILSSDPFWCSEFKDKGHLAKVGSHEPCEFNYYSLMALVVNQDFPKSEWPKTFKELTDSRFKGKLAMGSPLESGTFFTTVSVLSDRYGWEYFKALRSNDILASGGNSSVIQKVESGEKKVGMALLENILAAKKRGSPIEIIYPEDGSISIPSVQMIFNESKEKELAAKFCEFLLSREGQKLLLNGFMYVVKPGVGEPEGAKPFAEVTKKSPKWDSALIKKYSSKGLETKKIFSKTVLE